MSMSQTPAMAAHDPTLIYFSQEMVASAETVYNVNGISPISQAEAIRGPIATQSAPAEAIRDPRSAQAELVRIDPTDVGYPTSVGQ